MREPDGFMQDFLAAVSDGDKQAMERAFLALLGAYAAIYTRQEILMEVVGTTEWRRIVHLMNVGRVTEIRQIEYMRKIVKPD